MRKALLIATTALIMPLAGCGATYGDSAWRGGGLSVGTAPVGYWSSPSYRYDRNGSYPWWGQDGGEGGEYGEEGGDEEGGERGDSHGDWGEEGGDEHGDRDKDRDKDRDRDHDRKWSKKDDGRWDEQGENGERSWRDGESGDSGERSWRQDDRQRSENLWNNTDRDVNDVHAW
jgi:hypothetical protein